MPQRGLAVRAARGQWRCGAGSLPAQMGKRQAPTAMLALVNSRGLAARATKSALQPLMDFLIKAEGHARHVEAKRRAFAHQRSRRR